MQYYAPNETLEIPDNGDFLILVITLGDKPSSEPENPSLTI